MGKMLKKLSKKSDPFFRKNEEGKDIFYPWGFPGEAFYVDQKKKDQAGIIVSLAFGLSTAVILGILFDGFNKAVHFALMDYITSASAVFIPSMYIFCIYRFKKSAILYIEPKENRAPKRKVLALFFLNLIFQVLMVKDVLRNNETLSAPYLFFIVFITIGTLFLSYVLLRIHKTKGYYFTKTE